MANPQHGIFAEGTPQHWFLAFDLSGPAPAGLAADLASLREQAAGANPNDTVQVVVGFGPDAAAALGIEVADSFGAVGVIGTPERAPVVDQHDVFVWLHGSSHDRTFETALAAARCFGPPVVDVAAAVYRDSRDLTGFIDGTENPAAAEARDLAVVADGRAGAGGSILLAQRWVHDLDTFHALDLAEQEAVIGRTKDDSVELDPVPANAHIDRVVMEDDSGDEIEIYRRSVPYGTPTEAGLYFVAFTDHQPKIDDMLHAMFGSSGDGEHDRLTDFSRAVSTGYYWVPSAEALAAIS